jgi:hypothetical protein
MLKYYLDKLRLERVKGYVSNGLMQKVYRKMPGVHYSPFETYIRKINKYTRHLLQDNTST